MGKARKTTISAAEEDLIAIGRGQYKAPPPVSATVSVRSATTAQIASCNPAPRAAVTSDTKEVARKVLRLTADRKGALLAGMNKNAHIYLLLELVPPRWLPLIAHTDVVRCRIAPQPEAPHWEVVSVISLRRDQKEYRV